jgi:methionyl-tRNA formyltransferase
MTRAVVFAYHNVGVRCLAVLLEHGIDVRLVVTHHDNPAETIWFASVADLARSRGIAVIMPPDPNTPEVVERVAAERPDFLFSFYYRHMLGRDLLVLPAAGAYNMHGSLLPRYRGRVPVNWAIINGETETGVTLHAMTEKPDRGAVVAQRAVPIGIDDTAQDVFERVTGAAERTLDMVLPALLAGTAPHLPQDQAQASYFGGRKPEDGRIDFAWPARRIHDFVRALTRPYPGAFADVQGKRIVIWRSALAAAHATADGVRLVDGDELVLECADGSMLRLLDLEVDEKPVRAGELEAALGSRSVRLA